jgi:succinate dehydrogenase / fumarate reductase cytochrome b subunit
MNRKARPVKYQVTHYTKKIKWYSRSMGILGTLVLLYLVMHLSHFWIGTKDQLYGDHIQRNLYQEMKEVFTNPIWFTLYMVGLASLLFHLLHGFKSAFQSLGINDRSWTPLIEKIGVAYSIIIILVFAMMPVSFMAGWLK